MGAIAISISFWFVFISFWVVNMHWCGVEIFPPRSCHYWTIFVLCNGEDVVRMGSLVLCEFFVLVQWWRQWPGGFFSVHVFDKAMFGVDVKTVTCVLVFAGEWWSWAVWFGSSRMLWPEIADNFFMVANDVCWGTPCRPSGDLLGDRFCIASTFWALFWSFVSVFPPLCNSISYTVWLLDFSLRECRCSCIKAAHLWQFQARNMPYAVDFPWMSWLSSMLLFSLPHRLVSCTACYARLMHVQRLLKSFSFPYRMNKSKILLCSPTVYYIMLGMFKAMERGLLTVSFFMCKS